MQTEFDAKLRHVSDIKLSLVMPKTNDDTMVQLFSAQTLYDFSTFLELNNLQPGKIEGVIGCCFLRWVFMMHWYDIPATVCLMQEVSIFIVLFL